VPTFCRHNRLLHNCPICTREQQIEARPVVSSSAPRSSLPRTPGSSSSRKRSDAGRSPSASGGLRVRRLARGGDDGYRCSLVPGLKSSADAERLADELAFAATRLELLCYHPPGLYAEVADPASDLEERTWLAFLIAYIGPGDGEDPFASVQAVRTSWASGEQPDPAAIEPGPRGAHDPARGTSTLDAYRAWASRAGSQAAAFAGESAWAPPRRFARAFERLSLPGLHRDARFELLVSLGRLGLYELEAGSLALGGDNSVTVGAKRAFGIGDPLLLDRRAGELARACEIPLEALDLALFNWESRPPTGARATGGLPEDAEPDAEIAERTYGALAL
jgi:hypothetical protein